MKGLVGTTTSTTTNTSTNTTNSNYNPHLKDWQSGFCKVYYNISVDGIIGNETRTAMRKAILRRGSNNCLVGFLQARIGASIDNIFGANTEAKLREFQQRNGLEVDGICGYNTWNKLLELFK